MVDGPVPPGPERTTRVVAPIAFISVALDVRTSARKGVTLSCNADGIERVVPNPALMAWIRQQIGSDFEAPFPDEDGTHPWEEIASIVKAVAERLDIKDVPEISSKSPLVAPAESTRAKTGCPGADRPVPTGVAGGVGSPRRGPI
jgi:hypothetical protein